MPAQPGGDGTELLPFQTIAAAGQRVSPTTLQPGDVVIVKQGVYYGDTISLASGANGNTSQLITFRSDDGAKVVLDGGGSATNPSAVNLAGHSYIRIEGFEIRGYTGDVVTAGNGCQIVGNYIHHCTGYVDRTIDDKLHPAWTDGIGIEASNVQDTLIENNEIAWCGDIGIHASGQPQSAHHLIIRGNNIHHVGADGIDVAGSNILIERNRLSDSYWGWGHQDGILILAADYVVVRYNTIGDFTQLVYGGPDYQNHGPFRHVYIYGNVFYNSQYNSLYGGDCPGVYLQFDDAGDVQPADRIIREIQVHSNTFLFLGPTSGKAVTVYGSSGFALDGLQVQNNIFYASRGDGADSPMYDWGSFVDSLGHNTMSNVMSDNNCFYHSGYGGDLGWNLDPNSPPLYKSKAGPPAYTAGGELAECDQASWITSDNAGSLLESYSLGACPFNARVLPAFWDDGRLHSSLTGLVSLPPHLDGNGSPIFPGDDGPFQDIDRHIRPSSGTVLMGAYEYAGGGVTISGEYPYDTIQEAVNAAPSGATIIVTPGTYREAVNFGSKNLTIKSSDPRDPNVVAATIIDAQGQDTAIKLSADTQEPSSALEGLTIRGGGGTGTGGVLVRCPKTTIANCVIASNAGPGIAEASGLSGVSQNPLSVYNCVIANNTGYGVSIGGAGRSVRDCTITNSGSAGIGIATGGSATVANCIVWGNAGNQVAGSATIVATDTTTDPSFGGPGGVVGDLPTFPGGDYSLGIGSGCIDGGSSNQADIARDALDLDNNGVANEPVPLDIAGNRRVCGAAVDVGAYETAGGRWVWAATGAGRLGERRRLAEGERPAWRDARLPGFRDVPGLHRHRWNSGDRVVDRAGSRALPGLAPPDRGSAVIQSGGHLSVCHLELGGGTLSGGAFTVEGGGSLTAGTVRIACAPSSNGAFTLEAGGSTEIHILHIGCGSSASGTLIMLGSTLNADDIKVRPATANDCEAILQGYGMIQGPAGGEATIVNNGWVEADGYGPENEYTLTVTRFTPRCMISEQTEIPYGWYAMDYGRLELPVTAKGSGDYVWGSTDWQDPRYYFNLVNSMLISNPAVVSSGEPSIALLDWRRASEVPLPLLVGTQEAPTGYVPLAIWEFAGPAASSPPPFTAADITIRYDQTNDAAIQPCYSSAGEAGLILLEATKSSETWSWHIVSWDPGNVDSEHHTLSPSILTQVGQDWIRIATPIPFQSDGAVYLAVVQGYLPDDNSGITPVCDINLDGSTDIIDLLIFIPTIGVTRDDPLYDVACDFNADGSIDSIDLLTFIAAFGTDLRCGGGSQQAASLQGQSASQEWQALYDALEQAGLLEIYLDYIAEHPDAGQ